MGVESIDHNFLTGPARRRRSRVMGVESIDHNFLTGRPDEGAV